MAKQIDVQKALPIIKLHLEQGWSVTYSLGKAGISLYTHNKLLKDREYKDTIEKYRKCYENRSAYKHPY